MHSKTFLVHFQQVYCCLLTVHFSINYKQVFTRFGTSYGWEKYADILKTYNIFTFRYTFCSVGWARM